MAGIDLLGRFMVLFVRVEEGIIYTHSELSIRRQLLI